jgi:hypothetical protein
MQTADKEKTMLLRIKPMRVGEYIEPCILEIKGEQKESEFYPVAVVHVDNFWQGREGSNQVYNLLQSEKVVEIEISLIPLALDGVGYRPR